MQNNIGVLLYLICLGFLAQSCVAGTKKNVQSQTSATDEFRKTFKDQILDVSDIYSLFQERKGSPYKQLEFDQCTFKKTVGFGVLESSFQPFSGSCIFRNCTFESGVQGNMIQFLGQLSFGKCRFKQSITFQNSVFLGPVGFKECIFDGDAQFQNAIFLKESNWMTSHFYGLALFQSARFWEKAQFGNAVFQGSADFSLCRFDEGAGFDYLRAEEKMDFTDARNMGTISFRNTLLKRIQLVNMKSFGLVRFLGTTFSDSLITKGARFYGEPMEILEPKGSFLPKETR